MINSERFRAYRRLYDKVYSMEQYSGLISNISRVLVLAPHQDDEIIGCGGALLIHRKEGHQLRFCYLTDGCKGAIVNQSQAQIANTRQYEAMQIAKELNVNKALFWNNKDLELEITETNIDRMKKLLLENSPELIYAPTPFESHPDHYNTFKILQQAVRELIDEMKENDRLWSERYIHLYSVWNISITNYTLDISDLWDEKLRLLNIYNSQEVFHITELTQCIDRYYALQKQHRRMQYGEGYIRLSCKEVSEL